MSRAAYIFIRQEVVALNAAGNREDCEEGVVVLVGKKEKWVRKKCGGYVKLIWWVTEL